MDPAITGGRPHADMSVLTSLAQLNATAAEDPWTGEPSFVAPSLCRRVPGSWAWSGSSLARIAALAPLAPLLDERQSAVVYHAGTERAAQRVRGDAGVDFAVRQAPSGSTVVGHPRGRGHFSAQHLPLARLRCHGPRHRRHRGRADLPVGAAGHRRHGRAPNRRPDLPQIDQHGAENVSVYGDSAGGGLALAAVQELVRRGDPVPSHMVLISPELDVTFSDPASQHDRRPSTECLRDCKRGGGYGPATSTRPIRGSAPYTGRLAGLPPTAVYSGSLDLLSPDALRLRDRALAEGADFTFVLRKGLIHDWAIVPFLPEAFAVLPDIYHQLGIGSECLPLIADRQSGGRFDDQWARHRHPDAERPVDGPGTHRRRRPTLRTRRSCLPTRSPTPPQRRPHLPVNHRSCPRSSPRFFGSWVRSGTSWVWISRSR